MDLSPAVDENLISPSRDEGIVPRNLENSIELTPEATGITESERVYEANGRSRVSLVTLCLGLKKPDGQELIDINQEPWKSEAKSQIKPKAKDLKEEVKRRAALKDLHPMPRPNAWSVPELMEWLNNHPIQTLPDIRFLIRESERIKEMIHAAQKEEENEAAALQGADWRGNIPYLRLIHCLAEDNIKPAYLRRHNQVTRPQLDARNSESRPPTVYEMIAECWNSPAFNPSTAVSDCHFDYSSPIDLGYPVVQVFQPATARKVEDKLTQLRASLTRIIAKWEKSGQGDGGHFDSDDDEEESASRNTIDESNPQFGVLQDRPQFALDTRSAFLQGKPSYLLYFWEFVDKHGLLSTTLQKINRQVSAVDGASSVPSTMTGPSSVAATKPLRKRDAGQAELVASIREASKVQITVSNSEVKAAKEMQLESRLAQLRDEKRRIRREVNDLQLSDNPSDARMQYYMEELQELEDEIREINTKLSSLPDAINM